MSNAGEHDRAKDADALVSTRAQRYDAAVSPRVVDSAALLDGRSQLAILHNETVYFLRQTRFGKLILTK
jgi:hemin uptake protein HemP